MSDGFEGCKFCRAQALHVEEMAEEIRQLKEQLYGVGWSAPREFALTPCQSSILGCLVAHDRTVAKWLLLEACRDQPKAYSRDVHEKTIDTQVCKMRARLKCFGLEIETVWGRGFRLTPETRTRLLNWTSNTRSKAA